MSDDRPDPIFVPMDGMLLTANMLMGALRRQAIVALGGEIDAAGHCVSYESIQVKEIEALMVKFAAQGFIDLARTMGFLSQAGFRAFVNKVARELEARGMPRAIVDEMDKPS